MPRSVEVRRATAEDVDSLLDLAHRLRAEAGRHHHRLDPPGTRTKLLAALTRADVDVLVAWSAKEPVGALVLRAGELVPLGGSDALHIEQLFVLPAWRGRGVARQLLAAATTSAEHAGLVDVVCAVPATGREAHRFLARLGFLPLVTQRVVSTAMLRRRLCSGDAEPARVSLQVVLARRRATSVARRAAGR